MPFDPHPIATIPDSRAQRPVALWLFVLCAMVLVMVSLGGATRLTGSGLSIMEWAPIMGSVPPLSDAEWQRLFTLYQRIPQYDLVNRGFGLDGFKSIFWLEWTHRLWGRLMGLAFAIPLGWFVWRRRIDRPLAQRLVLLLVLGGLQGAVGWLMVASGFEADRTAVSPYRLVAHLALAVTLYATLFWTALDLWRAPSVAPPRSTRLLTQGVLVAVSITILAGGFVAGLKAGLTYNSFPLMDGRLVPEGYGTLIPGYRNLFENVAAVQFNHRVLATVTAILSLAAAVRLARWLPRIAIGLAAAVALQYALGITTVLWAVPVPLGVAHQAGAMLVLTAALAALHRQRPPTKVRTR